MEDFCLFGGLLGGLFGGPSGPTEASSTAFVIADDALGEGRYQVTVTYTGAAADEISEGNRTASGQLRSEVLFSIGENSSVVGSDEAEVTSSPETVVLQYVAQVPAGGSAIVKGAVISDAAANGSGSSGSNQTTVDSTDITVERI